MTDRREPATETMTAFAFRREREHREETAEGRSYWRCIPITEADIWATRREAEAAALREAPDQRLREALFHGDEPVSTIVRWYADKVAWPHSGYDPAIAYRAWADRIDAALATEGEPTAPEPRETLDVERLARALGTVMHDTPRVGCESCLNMATKMAAAYRAAPESREAGT